MIAELASLAAVLTRHDFLRRRQLQFQTVLARHLVVERNSGASIRLRRNRQFFGMILPKTTLPAWVSRRVTTSS
jgi:hypothetical protein